MTTGRGARHGLAPGRRSCRDVDLIVLPGGFSYGDYLRCGAMAGRRPVMRAVKSACREGGMVPRHLQRLPGARPKAQLLPGAPDAQRRR